MDTIQFEKKQSEMSNSELIELAEKETSKLCKTGGRSFSMSIPVRITDTDMILCELIKRFKESQPPND